MPFVRLALTLYFAAILSVAGLAKIEDPALFAAILRRQRLIPAWGIGFASRAAPWGEIGLAAALLAGIAPRLVAMIVLVVFAAFLVGQLLLFLRHRAVPCGCYGAWSARSVTGANVATSVLLLGFALLLCWLACTVPPVATLWQRLASAGCLVSAAWIGWRIRQRHRALICSLSRR